MAGSNQQPAKWPISVTRGDTLIVTDFQLERDGVAWEVDSAIAQVRTGRSRTSPVVIELTATVAGSVVSLGGDVIDVDPGVFFFDLEVTVSDDRLTIIADTFQVLDDVSEAE